MPIQGQFTKRGAALAIDYVTGRAFQKTATHTTYLALLTATMPSDDFTPAQITEVTATGYARQPITWGAPVVPTDGSSSEITGFNNAVITYGPFTASGGLAIPAVAAVLLQNSSGTSGDAIIYWELDTQVFANQGESITAAVNGLTISLA